MSSTTVPAAPAMADDEKEKSTNQILQALDALSHTLYQARSNFRSTSLALPRSAAADVNDAAEAAGADAPRPRSRRLSLMAPFRSRSSSKLDKNENADDDEDDDDDDEDDTVAPLKNTPGFAAVAAAEANGDSAKKGRIWSWAPIRALSHIGMRRMGCLFSVEVVAAQGLPPSMNGLRLAVVVRKKEARDGAVQTMPARAEQGAADFDETLFIRCHLYGTGGGSGGKPLRFEPRPFLLSLLAVEAPELDFGRSIVDLSLFAKEFTDKCQQGECVRQWDMVFPLAGKAKGGEMVIKLAFQSIDDGGGAGMYSQPESAAAAETEKSSSSSSLSSLARKIRKSSFSMMLTPRVTRTDPMLAPNMRGIDNFKLDDDVATKEEQQKEAPQPEKEEQQKEAPEPETKVEQKEAPGPVTEEQHKEVPEPVTEEQQEAPEKEAVEEQQNEPVPEMAEDAQANDDDDVKIPDFEVVDKGVEAQEENVDDLKEEVAGGEGVKEALQPMAMLCDVADVAADESVEPPPPQEEVAPLDDAKEEELAGESLQVPEQEGGGKDDAAGKSPPPGGFGWRTIAIVVAPVAVLVSKTLAGR